MINAKFKKCKFIAGATKAERIPSNLIVNEVAFAGRSNVGKSSLINVLTFQKNLAKISKTPGRTQQINFFAIEDFITLVDLPGYGYSKVSKSRIKDWSQLIAFYVSSRNLLKQLFLLIDARRGLLENDLAVMKWLQHYNVSYRIVVTKVDKLTECEIDSLLTNMKESKPNLEDFILTSTKEGLGIKQLRNVISSYS